MQPLPRYRIYTRARDYGTIAREFLTGRWSKGDSCRELEAAMVERGAGHAVCTARARIAIHLTIRAAVKPGHKVIMSPYTISDVVNMVVSAGGVPVFADTERETCNIDAAEIERLIDDQTGAVMVTHLHGLACDMERITAMCKMRGVPLIEDSAQAFGTRIGDRWTGTFGDAGIYSFGKYKNVNAFFGGMVVTREAELAERIREEMAAFTPQDLSAFLSEVTGGLASDVATHPAVFKSFTYHVFRYGFLHDVGFLNNQVTIERNPELRRELPESYQIRMNPVQARLVLSQLDGVDDAIRARKNFAEIYYEGLRDIPEIILPPMRTDFSHTYTYFPIQVEEREKVLRHLMTEHRDVAGQHLKNCADLECFSEYHRECPNARFTAVSLVLLPTYPRYSARDVDANIASLRRYYGRS